MHMSRGLFRQMGGYQAGLIGLVLLAGCRQGDRMGHEAPSKSSAAAIAAAAIETPPQGQDPSRGAAQGQGPVHGGADCPGAELTREPSVDSLREHTDPSGKKHWSGGKPLDNASVVSVGDLLASPDKYAGKTVRLQGQVNAFCQHRRAWFSMQDERDRSGVFLRVLAAPAFLVPEHAMGMRVDVEGTVVVRDESEAFARHLAQSHNLGSAPSPGMSPKRVILQATGATFTSS